MSEVFVIAFAGNATYSFVRQEKHWGKWGDAEGVSMVFECDLKAKRVKAYNVCT